jgi:hypothetical protein
MGFRVPKPRRLLGLATLAMGGLGLRPSRKMTKICPRNRQEGLNCGVSIGGMPHMIVVP